MGNSSKASLLLRAIFLWLVIGGAPVIASAAPPVLDFSDLTWGPKTGWEGSTSMGAAVTVWGEHFGSARGSSFVTVNGAALTSDTDYAEWGALGPARGLQRITFWLNSNCADGAGNITVTVNGTTSNALPFTVSAGTIYFISATTGSNSNNGLYSTAQGGANGPFRDLYMFNPGQDAYHSTGSRNPSGDGQYIVYVRGGTYSTQDPTGDSTLISLRGPYGSPTTQKALIGYPGETPVLQIQNTTRGAVWVADYSPYGLDSYFTFAKLTFDGNSYTGDAGDAIDMFGNYNRVIGNHMLNILDHAWSGVVFTANSQYISIYGNFFDHCGAITEGSYKHNIYIVSTNLAVNQPGMYHDVAWNEFANAESGTDNRGGVIQFRTASDAPSGTTSYGYFHDNYFHDGNMNFFEIGDGTPQDHIWIYNNLFVGGNSVNDMVYFRWTTTNAYLYNNTFYLTGGATGGATSDGVVGMNDFANTTTSVVAANNIFYLATGAQAYGNTGQYYGVLSSDHDLFYSVGGPPALPSSGGSLTLTSPIVADPLFVNAAANDFHLQATSPAIDAATSSVSAIVTEDYDGVTRPQGGGYDVGAYEYAAGGGAPPVTVSLAPQSATLPASGTQQFAATVGGTTNTAVTWSMSPSVGTLSSSGLYTAPSSINSQQSVQVTATSVADATKSASATITLQPPAPVVSVSVTPPTVNLGQSQTQQFSAVVTGSSNTAVTWSLSPSVGTLSPSGLYTAPSTISSQQSVQVTATSTADTTATAIATITLQPPAPVVSVGVTPGTVNLLAGATQQFTATVNGTSNTAVTWSMTPNVGTLSASGLYTAPGSISSQQSVQVTATSVADTTKSGTATITLQPTAPVVSVNVIPGAVSLSAGGTQQFTAAVSGASNTAVTWSMSPSVGTLSATGLYTAPGSITTQMSVQVTATSVADTSKSASAMIALTPATSSGGYSVSWTPVSPSGFAFTTYKLVRTTLAAGTQVRVTWTAPAGHSPYDAIWLSGDDSVSWWYVWQGQTGAATSGSFLVDLPGGPGLYQFHYVSASNNQVMAVSADMQLNVTAFSATATPTSVAASGTLTVSWTAPAGRPQTWADIIGLYAVGSTNDNPVWSQYTMGATSGTFTLPAPAATGAYEFRYVTDYVMTARSATVSVQ